MIVEDKKEKFLDPLIKEQRAGNVFINKGSKTIRAPQVAFNTSESVEFVKDLLRNLYVRNGPFKGMKYAKAISPGSNIAPKLIGFYERELWPAINKVIETKYDSIVNIGCAEGYYAIGLSLRMKDVKIFAFDINKTAQELCLQNSKLNNVEVIIDGLCDKEKLLSLDLGKKSFILIDIEGDEINLINKDIISKLANHDFLIETHDFKDIRITRFMINALKDTHNIQIFSSIDDITKSYTYKIPGLETNSLEDRKCLLQEGRAHNNEMGLCNY